MFPFAMQCFFLINKRFFFVSFYFFFYIVHLYTSVNVCPFKKYIYGRPNNKQSAKNQSSIPLTKRRRGNTTRNTPPQKQV